MTISKTATTVAIVYGLNEGPGMARQLVRALNAAGFRVVTNPADADVIIAHSGGCYILDPQPNQHVVMVGLPYWPGRSLPQALLRKVAQDARVHHREGRLPFLLRKTGWNLIYFWNIPTHLSMLRGQRRGNFWAHQNVTLVRNIDDVMCTPDLASLPFTTAPRTVELPGAHDDCWLHPERIVQVLQTLPPKQ